MGILTVGVVSKPFRLEGARRMRTAEAGIAELQRIVDTLIVIPNQNLFRIATDNTTFEEKQYGDIWTNDEYLQFMYERITLIRELLSDTGSLFLHCDWHKAHYIRLILDDVFGRDSFRNEIIWSYKSAGMSTSTFPRKHDNIFYYSKTINRKFFPIYVPHEEKVLKRFQRDENGPYQLVNGKKYYATISI
jgi:adenine specific DNA methylase Mod